MKYSSGRSFTSFGSSAVTEMNRDWFCLYKVTTWAAVLELSFELTQMWDCRGGKDHFHQSHRLKLFWPNERILVICVLCWIETLTVSCLGSHEFTSWMYKWKRSRARSKTEAKRDRWARDSQTLNPMTASAQSPSMHFTNPISSSTELFATFGGGQTVQYRRFPNSRKKLRSS